MKKLIKKHWPIFIALVVLLISLVSLLLLSLHKTQGKLIYTLDDAYIHMSMAKNLSKYGIYGITQYEFTSSSSSPLWTIIIAAVYFIFGINESVPFIINSVLSVILLIVIYGILKNSSLGNFLVFVMLIIAIYFTPLLALIFTGMEHVLHILLCFIFIWVIAALMLEENERMAQKNSLLLFFLTIFIAMTRFESYAIILSGCILLLLKRKWKLTILIAIAGILPLVIYQMISVHHGWPILPNSILIRSQIYKYELFNSQQVMVINTAKYGLRVFFANLIFNFFTAQHLSLLVLLAILLLIVLLWISRPKWTKFIVVLVFFVITGSLHLQFGKIGHFYRYEAYLIPVGLIANLFGGIEIYKLKKKILRNKTISIILLMGLLYFMSFGLTALVSRGYNAFVQIPLASKNIYEQQYQMALFLREFYPQATVALNDIGAISFLTDVRLVDLVGLASNDVFKSRLEGSYKKDKIEEICRRNGVDIAILYDVWFYFEDIGGIPESWVMVGNWTISDNVVCGSSKVSFYAVKAEEKENLLKNLKLFANRLPPTVKQSGAYLELKN